MAEFAVTADKALSGIELNAPIVYHLRSLAASVSSCASWCPQQRRWVVKGLDLLSNASLVPRLTAASSSILRKVKAAAAILQSGVGQTCVRCCLVLFAHRAAAAANVLQQL